MIKKLTWSDAVKIKRTDRKQKEQAVQISADNMNRIANYHGTSKICYPEYAKSFDYVISCCPSVKASEVSLYFCPAAYLKKIGYDRVAGFYDVSHRVVVICEDTDKITVSKQNGPFESVRGKFEIDEIIVHELLHYAHHAMGYMGISINLEEEFAYGNSVGYLKKKGYSDEEIIRYNFLPYLIQTINTRKIFAQVIGEQLSTLTPDKLKRLFKKHEQEIFDIVEEIALEKGRKLILIYSEQITDNVSINKSMKTNRLDFLDLS